MISTETYQSLIETKLYDYMTVTVMVCLDTNIFLFFIIYFSWFNININIYFDDKEIYDCSHMIYHMIWGHRPRLWEKGLEGWY